MVKRFLVAVATLIIDAAAAVYRVRASLLEMAGLVCLVVFASHFGPRWAWGATGAALMLKAMELDRRGRRP